MSAKKSTRPRTSKPNPLDTPLVVIEEDSALVKPQAPKYSFPKSERGDLYKSNNNLGPGHYDAVDKTKKFNGYAFTKVPNRFSDSANGKPGVGQYDINDQEINLKRKAPGYQVSKGERRDPFEPNRETKGVPGAGNYNVSKKDTAKLSTIRSYTERFGSSANGVPGVGQYDVNDAALKVREKAPGYQTAKGEKKFYLDPNKETKGVPGAGNYNVSKKDTAKLSTIRSYTERFTSSANGVPGVGQYDVNDAALRLKEKAPGYQSTKGEKKFYLDPSKETKGVPGAGNYNVSKKDTAKLSTIHNYTERFTSSANGVPGVGQYDVNDAALKIKEKAPGYQAMKGERTFYLDPNKETKGVPGAGNYNPNIKDTAKLSTIHNYTERFGSSANGVPGVGQYDINDAALKLKEKAPGYQSDKVERKFYLEPNKETKGVPGAGNYNPNIKDTAKLSTIHNYTERFGSSANGVPGVGQYEASDALIKTKNKAPGYQTTKEERKNPFEPGKEKKQVPGAGRYYIEKKEINPISIRNYEKRMPEIKNMDPGVGEYNISQADKFTKESVIGNYKQNEKRFSDGKISDRPGPGQYEVKETRVLEGFQKFSTLSRGLIDEKPKLKK